MEREINCCSVALMHMMMVHGNCESGRMQCWAS